MQNLLGPSIGFKIMIFFCKYTISLELYSETVIALLCSWFRPL